MKNPFKRKKPEQEEFEESQTQEKQENWTPDQSESKGFHLPFTFTFTNPFSKKYRIGILLKVKRFIAAILMLVNFATFIMAISQPASFIFFLTAFIMFDYLWKTRRGKTVWKT